jgi:hypothetical protein
VGQSSGQFREAESKKGASMQVSDLVRQYHNAAGQIQMTGTAGVKKLASSLREMGAGNVFEGTVNSVKNGQVVLGLSNGQTVNARLDGKVSLKVGQSMFFQVKSNDGTTIAIRPFTVDGSSANLTLMDALKAAKLPVDGRNLSMVNMMMEEQMSIDRDSLTQMSRIVEQNPETNVGTLVQMQKLGIPITSEFIAQFENYMDDKQAIGKEMNAFIQELPQAMSAQELSTEQMQQMGKDILAIATEGLSEEVEIPENLLLAQNGAEEFSGIIDGQQAADGAEVTGATAEGTNGTEVAGTMEGAAGTDAAGTAEEAAGTDAAEAAAEGTTGAADGQNQTGAVGENGTEVAGATEGTGTNTTGAAETTAVPNTLGSILNSKQIQTLSANLKSLMGESAPKTTAFTGTVSLLNEIRDFLGTEQISDQARLSSLFSGEEFQKLIEDALSQQWMIKPGDLGKDNKINKLYEKLEGQLTRMENVVKASGQDPRSISALASDIRNNIEFMDKINENYTYVQIPLKMSGQNASGELYVYTNKKQLAEGKEDLTAFLHLDMDHLGPTDVSIRMRDRNVDTKFYFDDDRTYDLVEEHIPELEARLNAKGYSCSITVVNEEKQVNFVEDFLKKDQPTAGLVHRYSFDMRA